MFNNEAEVKRSLFIYSLVVGGLAGLAFALGTWGAEAISLLLSNGMLPLLKLLIGVTCCVLVGLLAGWLTKIFTTVLSNVLIWVFTAVVFNRLALYISFPGMQLMLGWFNPEAQKLVDLAIDYGVRTRAMVMLVIMVVFGMIIGLLVTSFIEEASIATYAFRRWSSLALWMIFFIGIGVLGDSLNNKPLRDAVAVVNDSIQFQLDHEGEDLPVEVQVRMGLTGVKPVLEQVHKPRRITPAGYDQMLVFLHVLVQFDDQFADCSVINNQMGTCKLVESP